MIDRLRIPSHVKFTMQPIRPRGKDQTPYFEAIYTEHWPGCSPEVMEGSKALLREVFKNAGPDIEIIDTDRETFTIRMRVSRAAIAAAMIGEFSGWIEQDNSKVSRFIAEAINKIIPDSISEQLKIGNSA